MVYLFLTTLLLTIIAYYLNNKELIAPSFLFSISFLFASFFAYLNKNKWGDLLTSGVFWVISLGILEFIIVCFIIRFVFQQKRIQHQDIVSINESFLNSTGRQKLIAIEIIQLFFIIMIIKEIKKVTGQSSLSVAINLLNYSTNGFITADYSLPTYVTLMQVFNLEFGIAGEYLFTKKLMILKKFDVVLFIEALIGTMGPLLNGSRGGTIFGILTIIIFMLMIQQNKSKWENINKLKYIFYILVGITGIMLLLQWSATLVGRNVDSIKFIDYISTYVGAEIKNLDLFINRAQFPINTDIFGKETFYPIITFLIKHAGLNMPLYDLDLPFQTANGYGLGNVSTTFYQWLYDFGYRGIPVLIFIMASVSEITYQISKKNNYKFAPSAKLFYGGTLAPCIAFSFFSNKFYESMDIISLILMFMIWFISNWFFSSNMYIEDIRKNDIK